MADKTLIISVFETEAQAEHVAAQLKEHDLIEHDAAGILAVDQTGELKVDKIGARSTGLGVGVGAVLWVLGPVGMVAGLGGGAVLGALHHKGLGLDEADRDRLAGQLAGGRAAVGVLTAKVPVDPIVAHFKAAGGVTEIHAASDEALAHVAALAPAT